MTMWFSRFELLLLLIPSFVSYADITYHRANMASDVMTFNNPACRITEASSSRNLPVIGANITPSSSDSFNLKVETIKGYHPYISLSSPLNITGLEGLGFTPDPNEITLKELTPSGIEREVPSSQQMLESTDAEETDFSTQLFFRLIKAKDKYPPKLIEVEATVTLACVQA